MHRSRFFANARNDNISLSLSTERGIKGVRSEYQPPFLFVIPSASLVPYSDTGGESKKIPLLSFLSFVIPLFYLSSRGHVAIWRLGGSFSSLCHPSRRAGIQ